MHEFHIPVMGIGFTIDTPVKVAKYGINSVISIGDDHLLERLRKHYCKVYDIHYYEIQADTKDSRARRITAYLNLIKSLVDRSFQALKQESLDSSEELQKYFSMLPEHSKLFKVYQNYKNERRESIRFALQKELKSKMICGEIEVNIMTKVDKTNYDKQGEKLPITENDGHSLLRGIALCSFKIGIVLSAGLNPRLYSYMADFECFFPNNFGVIEKKIILKVSDYRSAEIQSKFLAKKGLLVSEFRIESGINCGGHAFIGKANLIGPLLEEFKEKREYLKLSALEECEKVWRTMGITSKLQSFDLKITAQGGIGTHQEHEELRQHYKVSSTGWGTPFLLVPEVVNIDENTLKLLEKAEEKDLYLSNISPLGVPFNTIRGNSKELELLQRINKNRPGSSCPKKFLSFNTEFTDKPICTASRQYQHLKIQSIQSSDLPIEDQNREIAAVTSKTCLCVGLGSSALLVNDISKGKEEDAVAICPGPNLAYFNKRMSLQQMVNHIYGKADELAGVVRPHMFINELKLYVDYFKAQIAEIPSINYVKQVAFLQTFKEDLLTGIQYYQDYFSNTSPLSTGSRAGIIQSLLEFKNCLNTTFLRTPTPN